METPPIINHSSLKSQRPPLWYMDVTVYMVNDGGQANQLGVKKGWTLHSARLDDHEPYKTDTVDELLLAFKEATAKGGALTLSFNVTEKAEDSFKSYMGGKY